MPDDPGTPPPPAPQQLPPPGWYPDPDEPETRQRYWDGAAWVDSYAPVDTPIVDPQDPPQRLRHLRALAFAGLTFIALLEVFNIVADARYLGMLDDLIDGGTRTASEVDEAGDLADAGGLASGLGMVVVGSLTFLPWFHRAYENLRRLGVRNRRYSPGWAIGSWFVPIFNLFRPKQIANDLYRVTRGGTLHARAPIEEQPVSPLLHWWWAAYILIFVVSLSGTAYLSEDDEILPEEFTFDSLEDERAYYLTELLSSAVAIAAIALAMLVVRRITADQEAVIAGPSASVHTYVTPPGE